MSSALLEPPFVLVSRYVAPIQREASHIPRLPANDDASVDILNVQIFTFKFIFAVWSGREEGKESQKRNENAAHIWRRRVWPESDSA